MKARVLCLVTTVMFFIGSVVVMAGDDDVTARNPLLPPLFSIDSLSPEVQGGFLRSGDLLLPGEQDIPEVVISAEGMFLLDDEDDIDALSYGPWEGNITTEFVLIFSVDRQAVGGLPPDETLVSIGLPFNVQDQAIKNQAAGDAYMSLLLFTRMGFIPPGQPSHSNNNTLIINQGDAGGVDFRLSPPGVSPSTPVPPGTPQSNVNAGSGTQPPRSRLRGEDESGMGEGRPPEVLFSLTANSPSLSVLPGFGSGADIYLDRDPQEAGNEELYVGPYALGLMLDDDIDAMIVLDSDGLYQFTPGEDQVIFSLAPGSPSLFGEFGPGDLFTSSGFGMFEFYCDGDQLGLATADNLCMLDYVFCEDVLTCAADWAIGYQCVGDLDRDGDVDLADLALLLSSYGLCAGDPGFVPAADLDHDGCVDLADLATLLANYGTVCW